MGKDGKKRKSAEDVVVDGEENLTKKQKKKLREEKRLQKSREESGAKGNGDEEQNALIDNSTGEGNKSDGAQKEKQPKSGGTSGTSSTSSDKQEQHSKKLAKMLPTRVEKARRDQQKKIQAFVLDLKAKGVTDPKQVKKEKLKYKKLLEKRSGGRKMNKPKTNLGKN